MTITEDELRARLRLWRAPGFGGVSMQQLLAYFGALTHALASSDHELARAGLREDKIRLLRSSLNSNQDSADADLTWLHGSDRRSILTPEHPDYPQMLGDSRYSPPLLFALGNTGLLNDPQIAIVGSRKPTRGGLENAQAFSRHLAENGLCITSGLAMGVDAASHQSAMDVQGSTIAVIATGMDIVYPASNRKLAERIAKEGLIISEFPIGVTPQAHNFPRRNRIISGMSVGTLVVEAALRSGSLVTARHAMEQGREVFAIPGSIHNPMARGCHQLIRQGAKLVETASDILEEVAAQLHQYLSTPAAPPVKPRTAREKSTPTPMPLPLDDELSEDAVRIIEAIGHDPVPVDQIVLKTGLTTEEVSSMLLILELQGHVAACGGGHYMQLTPRE